MPTRRMGRPPLDEQDELNAVSVHVRVPAKDYDVLYAAARQRRVSVPELIRQRVLERRRPHEDDPDT